MDELKFMPNISHVISAKLNEAGIKTPLELHTLGSREAFMRIRMIDPGACLNLLYSLEGAIQGIRWHHLPPSCKKDLKSFLYALH